MEACKAANLNLEVSISDFGTGLLSGILKAFPDAVIQPDLFHWMTELGTEISSSRWRKPPGKMSGYSPFSPQYHAADKRIRHLLKKAYGNGYLKV